MGDPVTSGLNGLKRHGVSRVDKQPKRIFVLLVCVIIAFAIDAVAASQNPYPNEMKKFRLYAKYMAPLRPFISDRRLVVRVMGSGDGLQLSDWRIVPLFACQDATTTCSNPDRLYALEVSPKQRVSMLDVKFPPAFTHSFGSVSEINVTCDVYEDDYGLGYWIYSEDSAVGKKGDLMRIEYEPSQRLKQTAASPK